MEWSTYIWIAVALFMLARTLLADRSPIPETSGKVFKVSSAAELDTVLASNKHVVVDFYADWCPPCRAIAPIFSELADKHASDGRLAFAKVNVDHVNAVAGRYSVTAMPTFVFFQNGKPQGVNVEGFTPKQTVVMSSEGLVERVRGADRASLQAVVRAMASEGGDGSKKE
ncbi:thioredoxin [Colletotrichum graminicola]|uniref:Thioredoxin n=1 Tax=Colletotrichum graminicola (strain M1.001 / M2 / FGSC 10212) TaxID=645133 RepID=E3QU11_COLGM|nr:thioredoxin [Colletotrichum graminicola M1.001]EFQ34349.1 thioredoxin [Colletotrichum graminicola M1.001]WDK22505.1 thioredoxin [Colletotrichum graminicola]